MRAKPCIFPRLDYELYMRKMSISELSEKCGIEYKSLCRKLNGDTQIEVHEGIRIYLILGKPAPIEELFAESSDLHDRERRYCVYRYTNLKNNRIYIGQTKFSPDKRAGQDGNNYSGCKRFWMAIKEFGWESFHMEVLDRNLTKDQALELEKFYIKLYKSSNPDFGYNIAC